MNIEKQYLDLCAKVLSEGTEKKDRTGTGTKSLFGAMLTHNMSEGFPLLTTKKVFLRGIFEELMWFLRGETNIQPLIKKGVNIWVGDAYKKYYEYASKLKEPERHLHISDPEINAVRCLTKEEFIEKIKTDDWFAKQYGECGPIYGSQWRNWQGSGDTRIDQIKILIDTLKTNPDSRRMLVSALNVGELDKMILPPCHYGFQVWTKELSLDERVNLYKKKTGQTELTLPLTNQHLNTQKIPTRSISLMWNQRSMDIPLGGPFNIASYAMLLEILAKEVNMIPDELKCVIGDCHIYLNQVEGIEEQINREPKKLPFLSFEKREIFEDYQWEDFELIGYDPHLLIKFPLSN